MSGFVAALSFAIRVLAILLARLDRYRVRQDGAEEDRLVVNLISNQVSGRGFASMLKHLRHTLGRLCRYRADTALLQPA